MADLLIDGRFSFKNNKLDKNQMLKQIDEFEEKNATSTETLKSLEQISI